MNAMYLWPYLLPMMPIIVGLVLSFCVLWNQQFGADYWSNGWRCGLGFGLLVLSFLLIAEGVSVLLDRMGQL